MLKRALSNAHSLYSLNKGLTIFFIFCQKISGTFNFLCFTEIILHKVSMLFGFKHFCLTNEEFVFTFTIMFNIGFAFGTQFSCWMLGTFNSYNQFEILSGTFSLTRFYYYINEKP